MDKCMSCQFYDRKNAGAEGRSLQWGQCRRTSPMLSPTHNEKAYMIEGVWPTVRDDDWCGEWRSMPGVRRTGEPLGSPLVPKGPSVGAVPRVAPLSSMSAMSALGGGAIAQPSSYALSASSTTSAFD